MLNGSMQKKVEVKLEYCSGHKLLRTHMGVSLKIEVKWKF